PGLDLPSRRPPTPTADRRDRAVDGSAERGRSLRSLRDPSSLSPDRRGRSVVGRPTAFGADSVEPTMPRSPRPDRPRTRVERRPRTRSTPSLACTRNGRASWLYRCVGVAPGRVNAVVMRVRDFLVRLSETRHAREFSVHESSAYQYLDSPRLQAKFH